MDSSDVWLVVIGFLTSMATAILGAGGGTLLIALMPGLIPPAAIVPVHGIVQFFSNISRVMFAWRSVRWDLWKTYLLGTFIGVFLGSKIVLTLNSENIPLLLGVMILIVTWVPQLPFDKLPGRFFSFGIVNSFLAVLAGATGPLSSALLSREKLNRDSLVTTVGLFTATVHALKGVAFGLLGFSLAPYLKLIITMSVAVIFGSWAGTRVRVMLPEFSFQNMFRWLITLLSLRLIWISLA